MGTLKNPLESRLFIFVVYSGSAYECCIVYGNAVGGFLEVKTGRNGTCLLKPVQFLYYIYAFVNIIKLLVEKSPKKV